MNTSFAEAVLPCLKIEGKVYGRMSKLAVELLETFDKRDGTYRQAIPNDNFLDLLACYLLSHKNKPGFTERNRNAYMRIVIRRLTKYANSVLDAAHKVRMAEESRRKKAEDASKDKEGAAADK